MSVTGCVQDTPEITVVIPVRNGEATLRVQLSALADQEDAPPFEVVISDNGSTDGTTAVAESFWQRFYMLRIVDASSAPGVSRARNAGVAAARAAKVAFCDADDRVAPAWVRSMSDSLDQFDVVGGTILPHALNRNHLPPIPPVNGLPSTLGFLPYAIGASLGVRKLVYEAVGGMDESFGEGHEEVDFAWRAQLRGFTIGCADRALVEYRQRDTLGGAFRQYRNYAASSIQLWSRYAPHYTLSLVSFRGSVIALGGDLAGLLRLLKPSLRIEYARSLAWSWGLVRGHIRYRFLRRKSVPELMNLDASEGSAS